MADDELCDRVLPSTWTMRDGTVIPISEMDDSHLFNAIAFLRRRNRAAVRCMAWQNALSAARYASTAPDGAADAAMGCVEPTLRGDHDDEILAERLGAFAALLNEARRRGLKI